MVAYPYCTEVQTGEKPYSMAGIEAMTGWTELPAYGRIKDMGISPPAARFFKDSRRHFGEKRTCGGGISLTNIDSSKHIKLVRLDPDQLSADRLGLVFFIDPWLRT